jgi:protein ImuB
MVRDLRVLGFDRVGDVLAQPRAPLALRFGPELGRRLDQATGRLAEPIEPSRPEALIEVRRAFAEPIGAAQTVARYIGELAAQLCDALEGRGLGARRLDLICHRVDGQAQAVRVGTGLPLRDVKRITRLLCDKIETIDPGFGIEVMTLAATVTEPLAPKQASSGLIDPPEPDVSGLIDLLANRVGEKNLYRAAPWPATYRSARSDISRRCHLRPARNGLGAGHGRRGCSPGPKRSTQWRCCRITHRLLSHGAACAGG